MSTKAQPKEDAPMAPAAVVAVMVEITRNWQNLEKDMKLLRARTDKGELSERLLAATLSATLFASELMASLVRLQIALADERSA